MIAALKPRAEYRQAHGFVAEVIRTDRRKTADIRVEDGAVSVVVPKHISAEKIDQLLVRKRQWIKEKIALHKQMRPAGNKVYVSGEAFPYLGRNYRLKVVHGNFAPVRLVQGRLLVQVPQGSEQPHMVRNALVRWYKRQAEHKLAERVARYAPIVGVQPKDVGIKTFKSRWGSCTTKGELEFNWQIVLAPNRMVDYVVMHELCHLIHHDHSAQFWKEVARVMPEYGECREWLRVNGAGLRV